MMTLCTWVWGSMVFMMINPRTKGTGGSISLRQTNGLVWRIIRTDGVLKLITVKSEGSVRKYFQDQSYGAYNPHFDVFGPVTLSQNAEYYGAPDGNAHDIRPREMIIEACEQAKAKGANFAQYDNDNDGLIDFVYVIYAGYGEADGGGENTIWPHQWDVSVKGKYIDGKKLGRYACGCELDHIYVADGEGAAVAGQATDVLAAVQS